MRCPGAVLAAVLLVAGCGGRAAHPVALVQALDADLSCEHLKGELSNNNKRLQELAEESGAKPGYNIGMLVVDPLFLDLSDTQKKEAEALSARNARLAELMARRNCDAE